MCSGPGGVGGCRDQQRRRRPPNTGQGHPGGLPDDVATKDEASRGGLVQAGTGNQSQVEAAHIGPHRRVRFPFR